MDSEIARYVSPTAYMIFADPRHRQRAFEVLLDPTNDEHGVSLPTLKRLCARGTHPYLLVSPPR
jgi:hypothetical protein